MKVMQSILWVIGLMISSMMIAQASPLPMLEQTADKILATLDQHKAALKNDPKIIYKAVETYLLPLVDVAGMSRSVLGRQTWNKATAAQKMEFSKAFTYLVIRTYSSPLAQYSNEKIKFFPLRGSVNSRFIRVHSLIIRSEGKNIPLSYSLVSKDGQWKIYDISVEGVSLLQSFRSQFAEALQDSSIDELIKQMQKKQMHKAA